jgi:hypothetical protein
MTEHPRYHGSPDGDSETFRPPERRRLSPLAIVVIAVVITAVAFMVVLHIAGVAPHQ